MNQNAALLKRSVNQVKGLINVLKHVSIKDNEGTKVWFIDIDKIFTDKNFKIMYLSFENLEKVIRNGQFQKIPDPKLFMAGVTYYGTSKRSTKFEYEKNVFLPKTKISFSRFKSTLVLIK